MNTINLFIIYFLIMISPKPLSGKEIKSSSGGQEVERLKVEQPQLLPKEQEIIHREGQFPKLLTRDALASDIVGDRPNQEVGPTYVKLGFYVFDIAYIDDAKQTFYAKVRLTMRWFDPRLISDKEKIRQFPLNSIWNPLMTIVNSRNVEQLHEESVFVDEKGHVLYAQTFSGTFTVPLNLEAFPLDIHKMNILIRSFYSPSEVKLIIDEDLTGWAETLSIPDWIISNGQTTVKTVFSKEQNRDLSQMVFSFDINRKFGFYLWKIIIPLCLIVIMSWGVFWIPAERLEAQIGLSATAFLTLFAFQFAIAALLPKIAYQTRMDRFTMMCSLLVFFALIEAITTSYLVNKKKMHWVKALDRTSRVIFPLIFICGLTFAFYF